MVCCSYVRKVHCAVVGSCYTPGWPEQNVVAKLAFSKGASQFRRIFHREGASPTNQCSCQKTRVIAVSCGIERCAVYHLFLPQYTNLTDGQTDRIAIAIPRVALHAAAR